MIPKSIPAFVLVTVLLAGSTAFAQRAIDITKLDSLMLQIERHEKAMSAVMLWKNGEVLYHREIGYRQIWPTKIHSDSATEYHIGSVSKMFTASMIFQLIEENKLTLAAPLWTYFPEIPNAKLITIEMMLGHHSGIYDFTRDSSFGTWMMELRTEKQMVKVITAGKPKFAPGEKGEYSNSNFVLLGYIVEKITGKSYPKALAERITNKIGLLHTYYGGKIGARPNEAASFEKNDSGAWIAGPESDMSIPGGAGAIVSTTADLATFIDALMKGRIVSETSLKQMMTIKDGFGLGMFKQPFYQRWSYGHNGHIDDFLADVAYFPKDSTVFVELSNADDQAFNQTALGVLSIYYHIPFVIPEFKVFAIDNAILPQYEGVYTTTAMPMKITVKVHDKTLTAQATGQAPFPLEPTGADEFGFDAGGIKTKFHRARDGKVDRLSLVQGGTPIVFTRE